MTPPPIPPPDPDSDGKTRRSRTPSAVPLAVAVALLITVLAAILTPHHGREHPNVFPTGTPTNSLTGKGFDSVCGLPAGDQTVPTTAPAGTKWELVGKTAAPTAPAIFGPGNKSGLRSCFAHSPAGALYAAVNYNAVGQTPGARSLGPLMASGPGRDTLLAQPDTTAGEIPISQVVGFNFLAYDPTQAVIDIAARTQAGSSSLALFHVPMTMRWEGGDWKFVVAADGNVSRGTQQIESLDGYVAWSGV